MKEKGWSRVCQWSVWNEMSIEIDRLGVESGWQVERDREDGREEKRNHGAEWVHGGSNNPVITWEIRSGFDYQQGIKPLNSLRANQNQSSLLTKYKFVSLSLTLCTLESKSIQFTLIIIPRIPPPLIKSPKFFQLKFFLNSSHGSLKINKRIFVFLDWIRGKRMRFKDE